MRVADVAAALLGASTGFASAVWAIVGWSTFRARHWWLTFCYAALVAANLVGTALILAMLLRHPFDLPPGSTTIILLPLILLPPSLQLRSWMESRKLITVTVARNNE